MRRALVGRADARRACEGHDQYPAAAAARRTHSLARPRGGARHPRPHHGMCRAGRYRHLVDLAQYVRGARGLSPRAVPLARPYPARGQSQDLAAGARQGDARGAVHRRRARAAHAGDELTVSVDRITAIVLRQYYLIRGSFARVVPLFAWVAIDRVLWGFITKYLNSVTAAKVDFVPALLGAVLLWDFLVRVMQGVTMSFFEDVWSRNFLNIFSTPLLISEYLAGLVLSSIATSMIGLVVMLVLTTSFFGLSFFSYGLMIAPFLLMLFLCGIALGIVSSAVVLRLGPASEWFIWPLPALISPFAGVFYPISTLPTWMHYVSHLLPPSYVFEGMRGVVSGGTVPISSLLWGCGLSVLYVLLAGWFFARTYRHAVRSGLHTQNNTKTDTKKQKKREHRKTKPWP